MLLVLLTALVVQTEDFQIRQTLDVGNGSPSDFISVKYMQLKNNEFVLNYMLPPLYSYNSNIYYYDTTSNWFDTIATFADGYIFYSGDYDLDGKLDLLGMTVIDSSAISIIEQSDTDSIHKEITWTCGDSTFPGEFHTLGSTKLIKNDGVDRIYGAPNPYTTVSESYGWFYMESDSDNSYYFAYEDTFNRKVYVMDIGYLDKDSMLDVITMTHLGHKVYESKDMNQDSFVSVFDTTKGGSQYLKIIGDIDKDGNTDYITGGLAFAQSPAEWAHIIFENDADNHYYTKWDHRIQKDYGPESASFSGCGGDYGDIDGDGQDELVLCAGSIIEVFEVAGDDSFEMIWSMDNDTFSGSHVLVYDFTGNGRAEIIWTGQSDPQLPLTYDMEVMKTYIIEWDTLYDENKPTLDSAVAYEGTVVGDGIDEDDIVGLYFNRSMDTCTVNRGNIDEVLKLSNSHTWLDGIDSLGAVWWNTARDRMFIKFKTNTDKPTIAVGDTISPDSITINGSEPYRYPCYNEVILRGDFGPTGTEESREIKDVAELQSIRVTGCKTIEWNTNEEATLTVYDISGRELIKEESETTGEHKTDIKHLKNGIYFIKLKTEKNTITTKQLIIR
ncbi:MAG: T9SS type A sorting domain-containing protein [bacterium]